MARLEQEKPMHYSAIAKKMMEHDSVTLFSPTDVATFLHALHLHQKDGEVINQDGVYTIVCTQK
tara:strand:+ start:3755 stop:3946 length:192 start_codon:yes stop_codon:yes gene_type:complete